MFYLPTQSISICCHLCMKNNDLWGCDKNTNLVRKHRFFMVSNLFGTSCLINSNFSTKTLSIKYQTYLMSRIIDAFGQEIRICPNPNNFFSKTLLWDIAPKKNNILLNQTLRFTRMFHLIIMHTGILLSIFVDLPPLIDRDSPFLWPNCPRRPIPKIVPGILIPKTH